MESLSEIYVVLMALNEYWFAFGISIGSIGFGERELNSDSEKLTGYYESSSNHKEK